MTGAARSAPLMTAAGPRPAVVPHPERWLFVVAGAGWLLLVGLAVPGLIGHGFQHRATVGGGDLGLHVLGWIAMVAVMVPLVAPNVRYAAIRSPVRARGRVSVEVAAGWAAVWIGAVVVLGAGALLATSTLGPPAAIGGATAMAVVWQHTAVKRRSLTRCHRLLAPPLDRRRSRRTCRRFGVWLGVECVLSCWPLMALMAVAGHAPLVAAGTVGVAWYERRRRPHHDPGTAETSLAIVAIGATGLVLAVLTA